MVLRERVDRDEYARFTGHRTQAAQCLDLECPKVWAGAASAAAATRHAVEQGHVVRYSTASTHVYVPHWVVGGGVR